MRGRTEADADYAARCTAHRVAYRAERRAYQQQLWDEAAALRNNAQRESGTD